MVGALAMALGRARPPEAAVADRVQHRPLYALAAAAAGGVAAAVGGSDVAPLIVATLLAATAFYLVDITLLAAVVGNAEGESALRLLGRLCLPGRSRRSRDGLPSRSSSCSSGAGRRSRRSCWPGRSRRSSSYERWVHDALDRLREFDRLKDEFIAVVSHELRTPLASVYGAAMTLQRAGARRGDARTRCS